MDRPLFFVVFKEKKKRTTKSRTTIQRIVRLSNQFIGWWCLICFSLSLVRFFSPSPSSLYPSMLAHDIQKKREGKFILIGSIEKKKSQYKVKIQSLSLSLRRNLYDEDKFSANNQRIRMVNCSLSLSLCSFLMMMMIRMRGKKILMTIGSRIMSTSSIDR